ncbi:MAG: LysM peptidoglycan-binding domain-containing protein, partial [Gammaproteobacteria bacterium]|nr:LysM peptidoglycan-binding domain-containing protein [Gammaproteobacteria bacterium]
MTRIPASASVALAAMLPACAVALGLGEIEPQSYLNQPLVAEIPVFSEVPGEMAGLNVTLASRETFDQYGLPRPALLSDLRFSVVEGPQGGTIRVSSSRPVAEPFLTLLIEVRWAQGRLLREFTVLLDPPDFAGALTSQPLPAPAPVAAAEVAPVVPPAEVATPAAEPQLPAASVPQARQPAPPAEADVGGSHTVARNETLWGIADRYRPSTADINQMMVAIYRANPEAFAGNINRLRAGAVLRIPEMTAAERLTRREAAAEVSQQTRAWQAGAAPSAEAARLELVPPPEPAPAAASVPPASATATADPDALRSRLEESQRLLAVKDAELKALRDRVAALEEQSGESVGAVPAESRPAPAAEETPVEEQAATIQAPEAESAAPAPRTPPAEPGRRPGGGVIGAIGGLLTSVWLWAAAAVVLVVALLVARRRSGAEEPEVRIPLPTRRSEGAAAQPVTADSTMIVHEEPARSTGRLERRAVPRGGDEETALEKTISTEGPVNLDQSDPLAEADFHMAYGLYDQAADLLTAAVGREPGRRDLRLKLLDVYFVWENRDGFLKEARALLQRIGGESDPDWKRVVIMGKQLCPNDSLFTGAAGAAGDIVDLNLAGDGGGGVDLEISGDSGILDFTIDPEFSGQADSGDVTSIAEPTWRGASTAQTQEIPTIEVPAIDTGVTRETPTIENPALNSTLETPTIET